MRELAEEVGTGMTEDEYQELSQMCDTKHMTDDEARLFLGKELGFDPLRVQIIHEVEDYYIEEHRLKKWHSYTREPLYNSAYWNYFRFDVCGWSYECVNGDLRFYAS